MCRRVLIGVVIGQFLETCSNYGDPLRRLIGHLIGVPISQVFGEGALMCAGVPFRETCSKSGVAMRIGHVFGGAPLHLRGRIS